MVGLGHMHVGALWQNTGAGRGAPNLVKEALAAEPIYPYVYKGKSARQILFATKFNLKLEKELTTIAESASTSALVNKVVLPTMLTGDINPKSTASVVAKDKYQLAKQKAEAMYKKSYLEKPWSYMFAYYCEEDRARLCGGIGYVGHHGGGDCEMLDYHEYVSRVVYPTVFYMSLVTVCLLFVTYYYIFGTFASSYRGRYD
jgi:hypothetical protein